MLLDILVTEHLLLKQLTLGSMEWEEETRRRVQRGKT